MFGGAPATYEKGKSMSRSAAVTFKGNPLTLAGEAVQVGQAAPDFTVHYYEDGLQTISKPDLQGKPSIVSVVPSLDTPVCQIQTKRFNHGPLARARRSVVRTHTGNQKRLSAFFF